MQTQIPNRNPRQINIEYQVNVNSNTYTKEQTKTITHRISNKY